MILSMLIQGCSLMFIVKGFFFFLALDILSITAVTINS